MADQCDILVRLSQFERGDTALERQEEDLRSEARAEGKEVRKVWYETGSAFDPTNPRDVLAQALDALSAGEVPELKVWKLDRLSRRGMGHVGTILDRLEDAGAKITMKIERLDTSNEFHRSIIAYLAEQARTESKTISLRVTNAKVKSRKMAHWLGGPAPYGYRLVPADPDIPNKGKRLDFDPETVPVLRRIIGEALEGKSLTSIARGLNDDGIAAPRHGKPRCKDGVVMSSTWSTGTLSQLLRSPALIGWLPNSVFYVGTGSQKKERRLHAGVPARDPETGEPIVIGPAIMSLSERRDLLKILDARAAVDRRGQGRGTKGSFHLLIGRIYCECGARMGRSGVSYRCDGRRLGRSVPPNTMMANRVDDYVAEKALRKLAALEPGDPLLEQVAIRWIGQQAPEAMAELANRRAELQEAEAALADLEDAYFNVKRPEYKRFRSVEGKARYDELYAQSLGWVERARATLAAVELPDPEISPLLDYAQSRRRWDEEQDPLKRRDIVALIVDRVVIDHGAHRGRHLDNRVVQSRVHVFGPNGDEF